LVNINAVHTPQVGFMELYDEEQKSAFSLVLILSLFINLFLVTFACVESVLAATLPVSAV
jgi:hypothetical protein